MRSLLGWIVLLFAAVAAAVSSSGNRLLAVLGNAADKDAYSTLFADLEGECCGQSRELPFLLTGIHLRTRLPVEVRDSSQ